MYDSAENLQNIVTNMLMLWQYVAIMGFVFLLVLAYVTRNHE